MADITIEEFETQLADDEASEAAPPAEETPKPEAEGDGRWKGKSLGDIVSTLEATERALRISEEARQSSGGRQQQQPAAEPELTRDELQELMQTDPLAAVEYITKRERQQAEMNVDRRLSGLQSGTISNVESQMRAAYPLEFELFGDQISDFVKQMPDKSAFTSKQGWDDVVSYVRGKSGNFEKYIDRKMTGQTNDEQRTSARETQAKSSGATFNSRTGSSPRVVADAGQMDEVTRKIADEFISSGTFKNYDEYLKWSKMGNG